MSKWTSNDVLALAAGIAVGTGLAMPAIMTIFRPPEPERPVFFYTTVDGVTHTFPVCSKKWNGGSITLRDNGKDLTFTCDTNAPGTGWVKED